MGAHWTSWKNNKLERLALSKSASRSCLCSRQFFSGVQLHICSSMVTGGATGSIDQGERGSTSDSTLCSQSTEQKGKDERSKTNHLRKGPANFSTWKYIVLSTFTTIAKRKWCPRSNFCFVFAFRWNKKTFIHLCIFILQEILTLVCKSYLLFYKSYKPALYGRPTPFV